MLSTPLLLGKTELISLHRSAVNTVQQLLQSILLLQDFPYVCQNNDAEILLHLNISETDCIARIQETMVSTLPLKKIVQPYCQKLLSSILIIVFIRVSCMLTAYKEELFFLQDLLCETLLDPCFFNNAEK